jgi:predicted MFS family arabinose efflux permease
MLRRFTRTEVRAALVAVLLARTAVNGGHRVIYPFLPEIERGLGVSATVLGTVVALRALTGLAAPAVPWAAEHLGRRTVMLAGVTATILGCLLIAGADGLLLATPGLILAGVAKLLFDIPMQGWLSERVPYERRGRVLGATELTWALGLALTVPAGVLITLTSWRAPFVVVAALAVLGAIAVVALIAPDRPAHRVRRPLELRRSHVTILAVVLLFRGAAELLFLSYGRWLEADFGLSVAAIGLFTIVVVGSELAGEGSVTAFADRLGLRRTIFLGLLGSAVAYVAIGFVNASLAAAVVVVIVWFVSFEITIVAAIPFVSELAVESRDRLLSLKAMTSAGAAAVAAIAAPRVFAAGGIAASGQVAAACVLLAALLLIRVPAPARR